MLGIDPLIKDIPGYSEKYQIGEDGVIYNKITGDEVKQYIVKGYYSCNLNQKQYLTHRLLALTFIDNPENKPYVDHIDRIKTNNNLNNLRWVTPQQNSRNKQSLGYSIKLNKRVNIKYYYGQISIGIKRISKTFPFNELGLRQCAEWRLTQEKLYFGEHSSKIDIPLSNIDMTPQLYKTNTSGYEHIYITKSNTYNVQFKNKTKNFKTLEDAIKYRDNNTELK